MTHQKASAGQKAQAEQWCQYFEKNQQSAGQVLKETQKWENAESETAVAASLNTAVKEEKQVREQLLGTLAQDRQVLTTLLQGEQHAFHDAAAQIQGGSSVQTPSFSLPQELMAWRSTRLQL